MNLRYTARLQGLERRRPSGDPRGGVCNRGHSGSMPEIRFGQADVSAAVSLLTSGEVSSILSIPMTASVFACGHFAESVHPRNFPAASS